MSIELIRKEVDAIKTEYNESDPFTLCRDLDILVLKQPMGHSDDSCKGFFLTCDNIKSITVNCDLSPNMQRIIAAHELGHAILHYDKSGLSTFHDFNLFDSASIMEYEANIFAADLLISDEEVLEKLNADSSFFDAAALLKVPPELLDFKFRIMKREGYKIVEPPLLSNSNFLKNIKDENSQ